MNDDERRQLFNSFALRFPGAPLQQIVTTFNHFVQARAIGLSSDGRATLRSASTGGTWKH